MTVSEQVAKSEWEMIPGTTVVPFNFRLDDPAHLIVYQDGVEISSYTCPVYGPGGGNIILDAPTSATHIFSLVRKQPIEQEVDYDPYGPFPAEATEASMDSMAMMVQDQQVQIDQSLKLKHGVLGQTTDMPVPEAYKFLRWSSGEDQILNSIYGEDDLATQVAGASASAAAAAASETAAAASEAAALASENKAADWAEEAVDTEVEPGQYSALHWADKASQWAEAAVDAEVETGQYSALHWSDKAHQHAEAAEDVEVETGQYSALHWSAKSHGWAETDEDVEVAPGEYSARHYSLKASAAANNITAQRYTAVSTSGQTVINPGFSMDSVQKNAILYLDGVRQVVDIDFTIGTTTITLLTAIPSGVRIVVESIAATAGATPAYATECGDVDTTYAPDHYALDTVQTKTIDQHLGGIDTQLGFMGAYKNKIINGDFQIWQRGTSFTGITTTKFTADRWEAYDSGGSVGVARLGPSATLAGLGVNSSKYIKIYRTDAEDGWRLSQHIEDVWTLSGRTATLSFWEQCDAGIEVRVVLQQLYGTAGEASPAAFYDVPFTATGTWTKHTITVDVPSVAGKSIDDSDSSLWLAFICKNADSGAMRFSEVQLEEGARATSFEKLSPGEQLALCQRYYFRLEGNALYLLGQAVNANQVRFEATLPSLRATPTFESPGSYGLFRAGIDETSLVTSWAPFKSHAQHVVFHASSSGAFTVAVPYRMFAQSSSDYIGFDAEL